RQRARIGLWLERSEGLHDVHALTFDVAMKATFWQCSQVIHLVEFANKQRRLGIIATSCSQLRSRANAASNREFSFSVVGKCHAVDLAVRFNRHEDERVSVAGD